MASDKIENALIQMTDALVNFNDAISEIDDKFATGGSFKDTKAMVNGLSKQVGALGKVVKLLINSIKDSKVLSCGLGENADTLSRINADYLDDVDQKTLVGKLAINIQDPALKLAIGIKEISDYNDVNVPVLLKAISDRYRIDLCPDDVISARRISKAGTIVIAFADLKTGAKYFQIVTAMKTKGANTKGLPLYANFCLTTRRSSMLFAIRKAHKDGKLEKYFCDWDGSIVIVKKNSTAKIRLTSISNKSTNFILTTTSLQELTGIHLQ